MVCIQPLAASTRAELTPGIKRKSSARAARVKLASSMPAIWETYDYTIYIIYIYVYLLYTHMCIYIYFNYVHLYML